VEARRFFEAALAFGEINLAYMGRGRVYQKEGECQNAAADYARAMEAPAASDPPPAAVSDAIASFHQELAETCTGWLVVDCSPADLALVVDGEGAACGESLALSSGSHTVTGAAHGQFLDIEVEIRGMEHTRTALAIEAPVLTAVTGPAQAESGDALAWSLVGGGGVLIAVGGVFALLVNDANAEIARLASEESIDKGRADSLREDVNTYSIVEFAGIGVGLASLIAGTVLLMTTGDDAEEGASVWMPWFTNDGAGVIWRARSW
jgi:hypothetical protein